ncbi:MAG: hypothetical protein LW870_19100 [Pirellula sp.]|jgi:hypothetical protein|nr:hypothetical protein [Pirellula sp.]
MKPVVLIISPTDDVHACAVLSFLQKHHGEVDSYIWDTGCKSDYPRINFADDGYEIFVEDRWINGNEVGAVWWRRPKAVQIPKPIVDPQAKKHVVGSHGILLDAFIASLGGKCINEYSASNFADLKPNQLVIAKSVGLLTPSTLISNNYKKIAAFADAHGEIVVKPLGEMLGCFPAARIVNCDDLSNAVESIEVCPSIYQEAILDAVDIRVTIVGKQIFSARIKKNNEYADAHVDWRLDATSECIPHELAPETNEKLIALMNSLNLKYAAIDLRLKSDGTTWFLEVNTAGQYLWVEVDTRLPISASIAELLADVATQDQKLTELMSLPNRLDARSS